MAASWTARLPTPPAPPWTRTRSPGWTAAWSTSACHAVSAASGRVAVSACPTDRGLAARSAAGSVTYWAAAPSRSKSISP